MEATKLTVGSDIELLNKMLRRELAAAATYERAIQHVASPKQLAALKMNRESHATRAVVLSQQVRAQGGTPAAAAGPWGAFAKLLERGAALLGENVIARVLYEGEVALLSRYVADTHRLRSDAKLMLMAEILPEQRRARKRIAPREAQKLHASDAASHPS